MANSRSYESLVSLIYRELYPSTSWFVRGNSIQSRKITKRTVKERAVKVLELVQKCAKAVPEVSGVLAVL